MCVASTAASNYLSLMLSSTWRTSERESPKGLSGIAMFVCVVCVCLYVCACVYVHGTCVCARVCVCLYVYVHVLNTHA